MRLLAQLLIPALVFISVWLILYRRTAQNQVAEQSLIQDAPAPPENKPLSNLGIVSILFISALVTLASILVLQQLLA